MRHAGMRRQLLWRWWGYLSLTLAPLLVISWLPERYLVTFKELAMPLFIAGCLSLFVSLRLFRHYKHALFATAPTFDTDAEAGAWQRLAQTQRRGFIGAALPAWIAALALCIGLEGLAVGLLALASMTIMLLYRLPRQLC